jgi:hypothetical protein
MSEEPIWDAPPLAPEDQRLVEAYLRTNRPLDELPYSEAFELLFRSLNQPDTTEARHSVFQRLLRLRKTGRLPRLGRSSAEVY